MRSVVKALGFLLSFETVFVLYLTAGRFKASPFFAALPVDLTLLFAGLSSVVGFFVLVGRRKVLYQTLVGALIYFLFAVWVAVTLLWAPLHPYAVDKTMRILALVSLSFLGAALIISPDHLRVRRFYTSLIFIAAWLSLAAWRTYLSASANSPQLMEILGGNYLGVGRIVGLGALLLFARYVSHDSWKFHRRTASFAVLIWFLLTLLIVGGRGPFLATVLPMGLFLLFFVREARFVSIAIFIVLVSFITSVFFPSTTLDRLGVLLHEPFGGASSKGRIERDYAAIGQMAAYPLFGGGVGSFYYYYGEPSLQRDYPHNLILEIAAEEGFVGVLLFLALVTYAVLNVNWKNIKSDWILLSAVLGTMNTFLNSMVSGDIPDNRLLFAALGLLIGLRSPASRRGVRSGR